MLEFYLQGKISLQKIIEKMCHAPAICFEVKDRGYIREGYFADLVLIDLKKQFVVRENIVGDNTNNGNVLYKCGWSPFNGKEFTGQVVTTFVNGFPVYQNETFDERQMGERLDFNP